MDTPLSEKSSNDEIRERFDGDVERFSDLSTGQAATIDAPLTMELITGAAVASTRRIAKVLDIGCGAGNNAIRLARAYEGVFDCDLCDLSLPMLERARERLGSESPGEIGLHQGIFVRFPCRKEPMISFWRELCFIICVSIRIGSKPSQRSSDSSVPEEVFGSPIWWPMNMRLCMV